MLLVGDDPASAVYVRGKTRACDEVGLFHETAALPATADHRARCSARVDGVQPPARTSTASSSSSRCRRRWTPTASCARVDPAKDVDGFHPENVGLLVQKRPRFVPCTPAGIMELLKRSGIAVAGRRAVVLGRSDIVGKPMALLLLHADATVTVCHSRTPDLASVTRRRTSWWRPSAGPASCARSTSARARWWSTSASTASSRAEAAADLLDAGRLRAFERGATPWSATCTSRRSPRWPSALTPVPGGVGPLTIAMLVANTVRAARARRLIAC